MTTDTPASSEPNKGERQVISGREAFQHSACELAQSAKLNLVIVSHVLERELYGESTFVEAVRSLATRHQYAKVRVLVHSPEWASRSGHRLIELARRLTSFIEIRELAEQNKDVTNEVLIADEKSLLLRESPDQLRALYYSNSPTDARQWLHKFDLLWETGETVQGFRRLEL